MFFLTKISTKNILPLAINKEIIKNQGNEYNSNSFKALLYVIVLRRLILSLH